LKRTVPDVLRRGFDLTVANWQVIALRMAEALVDGAIIIVSILAAVVPALVAAGLSWNDIAGAENAPEAIVTWLIAHWYLFLWFFLLAFVVTGVLMALHAFVEGGTAQILVDAERRRVAGLNAFSIDRWLAGGRASWWRIFWIYNLAWSVGLLFVLVPLMLTIVGMLVASGTGRIVVGCAGLALAVLVLLPVGFVTNVWMRKAIAICVARAMGARESLHLAWADFRADLGRHLVIGIIMFVLTIAIASAVSGLSVPMIFSSHRAPGLSLLFAPVRIIASVIQSACSAAIGAFFLACFVVMTEER
jgi:hypothetical protein